jgi:PAS domain S-box-containing protein
VLRFIGIFCGLITIILSMIVQYGWVIHSIPLIQVFPDFSPMQFNTAFCFFLCAFNLIFFNSSIKILRCTGLLAAIFALVTISQYLFQINLGIDTLFMQPFTKSNAAYIGRMSPVTAMNFIVIGIFLFLGANFGKNPWIKLRVIIVASIVLSLALVPLLAYLSGIQTATIWTNFTGMAVFTAFNFIFISIGLMCRIWQSNRDYSYSIALPIILCLLTTTFAMSAAINTFEKLKYNESQQEEAYYLNAVKNKEILTQPFKVKFHHRKNSYITYFVLFFGLLTSLLISLTIYFHIKWRQNVKALQNSEERLHLAITGTTDGLFDWDVATGKFYYSPRFEEVLGYQKTHLVPNYLNFLNLLHPDDKDNVEKEIAQRLKEKTFVNMEFRLKNSADQYLWFNFRGTPSLDEAGDVARITGFITDISLRNEIDTMKNEFVSTVSHELRTPMTAIGGSLKLILGGKVGDFDKKVRELLTIAERNCERLLRLINDILDIEKIEKGKINFVLEVCELARIINEAIVDNQSYADKFNIKMVFVPTEKFFVNADADRLTQVLVNLISNAIKFSKNNTEVKIIIEKIADKVRVNVIDEGRGIPEKFKERIFQKFAQADSSTTREKEGTGLGLSISKAIIDKLGGSMGFNSDLNKGTTFYFELPISK